MKGRKVKMTNQVKTVMLLSIFSMILAACGGNDETNQEKNDDKLQVTSSFTIISDMAREIGGDKVEVHNLVPTGTDPHEYEPLPEDTKQATDADILFYNGLNLEGGDDGWFSRLVDSVDQNEDHVISLTERVDPKYLEEDETDETQINPHGFIDPGVGIKMAEDMRDALMEVDADHADYYEEQGDKYVDRLKEIEEDYDERLGDLPEENKTLVTSECAYSYLLDHYDMDEACIWKIDTEENGSPQQIKSLISFIKDHEVPQLFLESNVDERPMETVSEESGVDIFDKPIYSDEIGEPGEEVDTYVKYLKYNIEVIEEGLSD